MLSMLSYGYIITRIICGDAVVLLNPGFSRLRLLELADPSRVIV